MPTAYEPAAGSSNAVTASRKRVGHLDQDPGTVAGVGLGAGSAAMLEVAQGAGCPWRRPRGRRGP